MMNLIEPRMVNMVELNDNAIEYMQMLGFHDVVLGVEKFTT